MLDWQNKKWIKVIATILVVTFLSYDIAWAVDFSPMPIHAPTLGIFPKITNFISRHILKKTSNTEEPQETEIAFRSQLVPTKKYEEQSGFMRLEAVREMIKRQLDDLNRRQNIEVDRNKSIYNQYQINRNLYMQNTEKGQSVQAIQNQVMKARGDTMEAAAAGGEFSYTMNKDGSRVNYIDGLPSSIENEPITDSYGYKSIKNTKNMKYDGQRFLMSYDADIRDSFGNITKLNWFDAVYSPDSVWWAGSDTNAGKYLLGYKEIVIDPYGTVSMREWSTARDSYGADKKVINYHEVLKDGLGNVVSTSDWSKGVYDGDKVKSYHQVTKDAYGNVSSLDWSGEYTDKGSISKVFSKEAQTNRDDSTSYSENTSLYTYDDAGVLKTAVGNGAFQANDGFGNMNSGTTLQQYEIVNGQLKLVRNITNINYENIDDSTAHSESTVNYYYNSKNLLKGADGKTTTEGWDIFGNGYKTSTVDAYEIIASQARRVKSVSINDAEDLFGSINHAETITTYKYNFITGELISATGYTDTTSEDVFGSKSVTHTDLVYQIINGQAKLVSSITTGDLINPASDFGQTIGGIQNFLESYGALSTPEERQAKLQEAGLGGLNLNLADLTTSGITIIVGWLWRASTRLINCAINSLYNILSNLGASVTKKELVQKAVLVDILTGVITPETATGELMLSMYSMAKAAQSKGIALNGASVTVDQLKSIGQPVIAYVGGDHYVVIKSIDAANITYIEKDDEYTVSVAEFLNMWGGIILTPVVPQGANVLNVEALKGIKGAEEPRKYYESWGSGGRHVQSWLLGDDKPTSGFELWRTGSPGDAGYYVYFHSWDDKGGDSVTELRNRNVYKKDSSDKGTTIIVAELMPRGTRGVKWADYWSHTNDNTDGQHTNEVIARIERSGNNYKIDGVSFGFDGLAVSTVHLDRTIGGGINTRNINVYRTDLSYEGGNPYAGGDNYNIVIPESLKYKPTIHITYDPYGFGIPFAATYGFNVPGLTTKSKIVLTVILGRWVTRAGGVMYFERFANPVKYDGSQSIGSYLLAEGDAAAGNMSLTPSNTTGRHEKREGNIITILTANIDVWSVIYGGNYSNGRLNFSITGNYIRKELTEDSSTRGNATYDEETGYWYVDVRGGADDPYTIQNESRSHKERIKDTDGVDGYDAGSVWESEESEGNWQNIQTYEILQDDPLEGGRNVVSQGYALNLGSDTDLSSRSITQDVSNIIDRMREEAEGNTSIYDNVPGSISFTQRSRLLVDGRIKLVRDYGTGLTLKIKDFKPMSPSSGGRVTNLMDPSKDFLLRNKGWHVYAGHTGATYNSGDMAGISPNRLSDSGHGINIIDGTISSDRESYIFGYNATRPQVGVASPSGVFATSAITPLLESQTILTFDSSNNVESLLMPDANAGVVKYLRKEIISENTFRMKSETLYMPEMRLTLTKDGQMTIEYIDSEKESVAISLENNKAVTQVRGADIEGSYEVSKDVYGNKIMLIDFQHKEIKEELNLKTSRNIVEAIKRFLEEKMNAVGIVPDKVRNALKNFSGIDKFIKWLTQMGTYVINCAIKAGIMILAKAGINLGIEELAVDTILLDLLDGNLSPKTTAILYSTFSTIEKVTQNRGLDLKTMYLTRTQLENITVPVIAHVGGDHAVIVTGVYKDEVYVIESDGKLYNVPMSEFLEQWSGFVLAARAPPMTLPQGPDVVIPQVNPPSTGFIASEIEKEFVTPYISTPQEKFTPEAIEKRLESAFAIKKSGQENRIFVTGLAPFGTNQFGDKISHTTFTSQNRNLDIITTIGSDGSLSYIESWVDYEYDADGRLIGATGGNGSWGEDIFGNSYATNATDIYIILAGQAKKIKTESTTTSENLDGSTSTNTGVLNYEYTDGTEDPAGVPPEYVDEDGNILVGLLKHADGESTTIGRDVFGGVYTTTSTDTYKIIKGEAKIEKNVSNTESQTISGTINKSQSTVTYTYTDGTEDPASVSSLYLDADGKVIAGFLSATSGRSEASSEDVFGNRYTTITSDTYIIIDNRPKVLTSDSVTTSTNLDGLRNVNTGHIEYTYSTAQNPYINPNTQRSGIGVLTGGNGTNIIVGEDVFGNTYTTTTTNVYGVTLNGQPKVLTATSLIEMQNLDGSIKREESFLSYEYTDGTEDPATLPPEYSDNGKVWIGLLKNANGNSNTYGEDVFGNKYTSSSTNHYTYRKGELFVDRVDTTTISEDAFGNSNTTTSWIKYSYGSLREGERGALRDADFVMLGAEGGSVTEGSDVYGA
ncbi:MAG: hypothetical protein KKB22_02990, partial [Candidatus Omnitrophica bacterium]|nr:hypothetical protein [Candidatus Omnitrophota bacterium]